tara:strand:- start:290 stop:433 length:144 start_codon:yes stop_codon:yes gene_type:complete
MEYITYELLDRIAVGFLAGVIGGIFVLQISALGWMFWDMFRSKKDGS